jgi:hypothetical protein
MIRIHSLVSLFLLAIGTSFASSLWPEFRGPTGQGIVAGGENLPLKWSETENITWKRRSMGAPGLPRSAMGRASG